MLNPEMRAALVVLAASALLAACGGPTAIAPDTPEALATNAGAAVGIGPTPAVVFVEGPYPEVPRVPLPEARSAFDSGSATFVDVRSAEAYAVGHVPGAINVPVAEMEARIHELDSAEWIITYCT